LGKLLHLKTAPANRAALIDEYGDIERLRREFAPTEKRYEQLREEIKSWFEASPADKEFIEKGARYQLTVSMRANARIVDIAAVYKKLGLKKFLRACSVTLKALAEFLTEPEIDALASSGRTGARSYVSTPLGLPAVPALGRLPGNAASGPDKVPEAA
jgi:hypothetical protein